MKFHIIDYTIFIEIEAPSKYRFGFFYEVNDGQHRYSSILFLISLAIIEF